MKDMLYAGAGLISAIIAAVSMWQYLGKGTTLFVVAAIIFGIAAIACLGLFLSGRVNKNEDIHVTE